jgi:tripartite ATP-independent transporter DctM subunit
MTLIVLVAVVVVLLILEVPISLALGLAAIAAALTTNVAPAEVLLIQMFTTANSFVLLAVPLFIFAGLLMARGGIAEDLVALAELPLQHVPGGLGMATVLACMFFSGITGAKVAEVAAISSTALPALERRGYPPAYATAIIAAASAAGELIPPAINMIILGQIMMLSTTKLFVGGVIPAVVLGFFTFAVVAFTAPRRLGERRHMERQLMWRALRGGVLALGMPLIIFGGLLGGVFSPTEAAAVAVLYSVIVVVGIYRRLGLRQVLEIACNSGIIGGALMLLVMTASAFAHIVTIERVPVLFAIWVGHFTHAPWIVLSLTVLIFLTLGSVLEGLPAMIIFVPVLVPLASSAGIDLIHFGIVVIAAVGVGLFLPPTGIGFVTACGVGRVTIPSVTRQYGLFLAGLVVGLFVLVFVPWFSIALPALVQ